MKVFNFFSHVFSIFSFLTIGSLLILVSLHILSYDDAVFKLQTIYENPWLSLQTGCVGFLFITVALGFTKMLVKKGRESDALIAESPRGPVVVSVGAMEDSIRKVIKRFNLVKDVRIKMTIKTKEVSVLLRLTLWSGGKVPELLSEVQREVYLRLRKLLGDLNKVQVACDVVKIEINHFEHGENNLKETVQLNP